MPASPSLSLAAHFAALDGPRVEGAKLHPLLSIVVIAICSVIGGAEGWDDIEDFGAIRADSGASFLDLPHGILVGQLRPTRWSASTMHTVMWTETSGGVGIRA